MEFSFNDEIAVKHGLKEAIVIGYILKEMQYVIGSDLNVIDGQYYAEISYECFLNMLNFFKEKFEVIEILEKLKKNKIVLNKGNMYSINFEEVF